jgi:hypothetical protein
MYLILSMPSMSPVRFKSSEGFKNDVGVDAAKLKAMLWNVEARLKALAEHLASIPKGVSRAPIFAQMGRLEETKALLRE